MHVCMYVCMHVCTHTCKLVHNKYVLPSSETVEGRTWSTMGSESNNLTLLSVACVVSSSAPSILPEVPDSSNTLMHTFINTLY